MKIQEIQSPNSNLSVQVYNVNGTEKYVLKDDKLYLDNSFDLSVHQHFEQLSDRELELITENLRLLKILWIFIITKIFDFW
ncbi:MAG: hypothetical protein LBR15_04845 [Methanobrevibacter sp.]|jgi:hypothetical protein|nr:hypothetical protein [Candidatus Methanovirga australis]